MEESEDFDMVKIVDYLHMRIDYMPPVGKPRDLITKWVPKNPLPY